MCEEDVLCLLDFYVHESVQRTGIGLDLFTSALKVQYLRTVRATDVGNEEYRASHGASYALGRATKYRMLGSNVKYMAFRFRFEAVLVLHALGDMSCIDTRSGTPCARTSISSTCVGYW